MSRSRFGHGIETVSLSGVTNTPAYDGLNRIVSSTDGPGNATTFLYNAQGQRVCVIDAATNVTWYAYDAFGRLAATTNALGEATVYEYNLQGRKTYEGGGTYPVRFTYDGEGRMMSMITYRDESGPGDTTAWVYDPATGLLVQKLYEDGKGTSYTYTPDGKLATRTWARGVTTTYSYDGWGNLTNIVHSDGTPSVSMAYDAMGRQIQTSDAAGVTAFAYDSFSSLTNETVAGQYAKSLDRYYDECGRNVGYSLDGQRKQTVAYDPATGRISTMDGFAWQYLPGSDLKRSLAYPNGTVAEWVYEPRRDLLTLVSNDVFSAYAYLNDAAGRRTAKNTEHYGYNNRGELIVATNTATAANYAYTFDDIGNRVVADELGTNIAYTANALNQYTNIVAEAPFTPAFDDDGNQTLVKTSTGIWNVMYNAENRPVVWSNETAVVTMDFDRMGRRVWYASVSGGETNAFSKFVYDGYLCILQLDGFTGDVEQEFVWDPTEPVATRPLKWTLPGLGRTFHYFHDGNKNVSDVIDAQVGTLAAHYDYAPFGAVTTATGPMAQTNPYRFSSEYHDTALGCVYYNYRHYNPLDGRWTTRDPMGEIGNGNIYSYIENVFWKFDLLGLITEECVCGECEIRITGRGSIIPGFQIVNYHQTIFAEELMKSIRKLFNDGWKEDWLDRYLPELIESMKHSPELAAAIMSSVGSSIQPQVNLSRATEFQIRYCRRKYLFGLIGPCCWNDWDNTKDTVTSPWVKPNSAAMGHYPPNEVYEWITLREEQNVQNVVDWLVKQTTQISTIANHSYTGKWFDEEILKKYNCRRVE